MSNKIRPSQLDAFTWRDVQSVLPTVNSAMGKVPLGFSLEECDINENEANDIALAPMAEIYGEKCHVGSIHFNYGTTSQGEVWISDETRWCIFHAASDELQVVIDNRVQQPLRMVGGDWVVKGAPRIYGNGTLYTMTVDPNAVYMVTFYMAMNLCRVEKLQELAPITE